MKASKDDNDLYKATVKKVHKCIKKMNVTNVSISGNSLIK